MTKPNDEQRASYIAANAALDAALAEIREARDALDAQIEALKAPKVTPALLALEAISDEIGDPHATCEGCGVLIWDGDDYSTDDDCEVYACPACVERWGGPGWAERDHVGEGRSDG